ncbi:MAG: hypothetical protein JWN67_1890 [Actinomycetia bacterium]|nr:hypothetical protein [Actinomycetes bacterium]
MTDYLVDLEWDGEVWVASAPEVKGAHTQARTLVSARSRVREVIALMEDLDDEQQFGLIETVKLPSAAEKALDEARTARRAADDAAEVAERTRGRAVAALSAASLSTRDVGELLDLSHSRIHQLLAGSDSVAVAVVDMMSTAVAGRKEAKGLLTSREVGNPKVSRTAATGRFTTSKGNSRNPKKATAASTIHQATPTKRNKKR